MPIPGTTTVREGWESFREAVLPADISWVEYLEMRKAFHAGAWDMLNNLICCGADGVSEGEGAAYIDRVKAELEAFNREVARGGGS